MRKIGRPRINERLSNEFLINKLKEAFLFLGRAPTHREIQYNIAFPNTRMYEIRFGSWAKALDAAGIPRVEYNKKGSGRKRSPTRSPTLKIRFEIFKRDNFTCQYCGRTPQDGANLLIDHRLAAANGGKEEFDNLVTACFECNIGKSDILLSEHQGKKIKKGQ
jgi:hypothetical protein